MEDSCGGGEEKDESEDRLALSVRLQDSATALHRIVYDQDIQAFKGYCKNGELRNIAVFLEKFPKLKTQLTATDKMCVNFGKRYKKITYCLNNATALGLALTVGSPVRTIRFLLKCGCSFDFEHFRKSPLHIAVSSKICPVETIECLFQSDLTTDASTPLGENGKTLLHHAVMANNSVEKLKVLINHKADLFSTDIQERTPLDCALVRSGSAKAREKVSTFLLDLYRKPMERDLASLHMLFPELYRAVFSGLKMEPKILEMLGATKIAKHKQDC